MKVLVVENKETKIFISGEQLNVYQTLGEGLSVKTGGARNLDSEIDVAGVKLSSSADITLLANTISTL